MKKSMTNTTVPAGWAENNIFAALVFREALFADEQFDNIERWLAQANVLRVM